MTRDELYEAILLRQAVGACRGQPIVDRFPDCGSATWMVRCPDTRADGPTLAAALTALLHDLGVEPVEWPSAKEVREAEQLTPRGVFTLAEDMGHLSRVITPDRLRDLAHREPMTALALLFGEDAR